MQLTAIIRSVSCLIGYQTSRLFGRDGRKVFRVMKLTAIILLTACLQVAARSEGQTVTMKMKNAPMKEVFRQIQKQTGLNILIDEAILENTGRVTLDVKDMPVTEVLNICFRN